jgi:Ca2+-binding RTX toxin-like protein
VNKATKELFETVMSYFSTPVDIISVAQGQNEQDKADAIKTYLGIAQIGSGFAQMIGKSIPYTGAPLNSFILSKDLLDIYKNYNDKGTISVSHILSVSSSISGLIATGAGIAATAGAAAAAPIFVGAALVATALTAASIVAEIYDTEIDVRNSVENLKSLMLNTAEMYGKAYTIPIDNLRTKVLPALSDMVDIQSVGDNKVEIISLQGGTHLVIDTTNLAAFGVDPKGDVYFHTTSNSQPGVSDRIVTIASDGSASVVVNGVPISTFPSGTLISVNNNGLVAEVTSGSIQGTFSISNEKTDIHWQNSDGTFVVNYVKNNDGTLDFVEWVQNGKTFTSGDLAAFITESTLQNADAKIASQMLQETAKLTASMSNVADGVAVVLDNVAALELLAKRIDLANIGDRWAFAFLDKNVAANLILLSQYSAAMAQAVKMLAQQRWQNDRPSIFTVRVLGFGNEPAAVAVHFSGGGSHYFPLVLDLDGKGINLVAPWQSNVDFDLNMDGTKEATGWVGPTNGILVFDRNGNGQIDNASEWFGESFTSDGSISTTNHNGFSALSTLAQSGATVFDRNTALYDKTTGKSYFDLVQVWVDANQDGITDKGELKTLIELGIASLDLQAIPSGTVLNGSVISLTAGYTRADGTRGDLVDIGLSENGTISSLNEGAPNSNALIFSEYVSKGYAALAKSQSMAVMSALNANRVDISNIEGNLKNWMATKRRAESKGNYVPLSAQYDPNLIVIYPGADIFRYELHKKSNAGIDSLYLLQQSSILYESIIPAANLVKESLDAIISAQISAQIANVDNNNLNRTSSTNKALTASLVLGNAVDTYLQLHTRALQLNILVESLRTELNQFVPVNMSYEAHLPNGYTFYSPTDANLAASASAAFASSLQILHNAKAAMDGILGALAQSAGYGKVYVGKKGEELIVGNDFNLLLAGDGTQNFLLGTSVDHIVLSAVSEHIKLQGFQTGSSGDQLQFLGLGKNVSVLSIENGIRIVAANGKSYADLLGVDIQNFNLYANLVGVEAISFAQFGRSGIRTLYSDRIHDGQVHINEITASNFGDTLVGGIGSTLNGGGGNDTFIVLGMNYHIDGHNGNDTVSYVGLNGGVTVNLGKGTDSLGSTIYRTENITGSMWRDHLIGNAQNNIFDGKAGYDTIEGGGGNDVYLFGRGDGADTIVNGIASNSGASSILRMKEGIGTDDIWVSRQNNDLVVNILGSEDRVQIKDWFTHSYRKLSVIELANGLRLNTMAIDKLVETLAELHKINPNFDPRINAMLPAGLSLSHYFSENVPLPEVPTISNVALNVQRTYKSNQVVRAAESALQEGQKLAVIKADIALSLDTVKAVGEKIPFINVGDRYYLYRYQSTYHPGFTLIASSISDWANIRPPVRLGDDVIAWTKLSSLAADRFYLKQISTSDSKYDSTYSEIIVEGPIGLVDELSDAYEKAVTQLNKMTIVAESIAIAANARQSALESAVHTHALSNNENIGNARDKALNFEQKLNSAIAAYQTLDGNLSEIAAILALNKTKLAAIFPASSSTTYQEWIRPSTFPIRRDGYWRTVTANKTYDFYSKVDSDKFDALQNTQLMAENSYLSALNAKADLLKIFGSFDDFAAVQISQHAGVVSAGKEGDLIIAAHGGNHVFNGGAGRDTFMFSNMDTTASEIVKGFQAGINGDRLFIIPASSRTGYFYQNAAHDIMVSYSLSKGGETNIRLQDVSYEKFSLYDNVIGIDTASFERSTQNVSINLHSLTPRDADGYTHVRNIIGSNYNDVFFGDSQDNRIFGGAGNDVISGGAGNNILDGGTGNDTVSYADSIAGVVVNLNTNTVQNSFGGTDTLISIENITGSSFNDVLIGNNEANVLQGGEGNDTLDGGAGNDLLIGGKGNDIYLFAVGSGQDIIEEDDDTEGNIDKIVFASEITPLDVQIKRDGQDLVVQYSTTDTVTIRGWFISPSKQIEYIIFSDGTQWSADFITSKINSPPTGSVNIDGVAKQNQMLFATNTLVDPNGMGALAYQWQRSVDGVSWLDVSGAIQDHFQLGQAEVGNQIRVVVSYIDLRGNLEMVASAKTQIVENVNDEPVGEVVISGDFIQRKMLLATTSISDADGMGELTYQWQSSADGKTWSNIAGATARGFLLRQEQVGYTIRVIVSYTDLFGTSESLISAASKAIENVNDAPIGLVTISGLTMPGQELSASHNLIDADGLGIITYQWQRLIDDGTWQNIENETAITYTLKNTDIGYRVRVIASYTDGYGTMESVTAASTSVITLEPKNRHEGTAGNDTMIGGMGNDEYVVNHVLDKVVEAQNGGTDTVFSSVTYTLPANVENLILTGNLAINATGNELNNILIGNSGNNTLNGGAGADVMEGGLGDDIYYVDNINDRVIERFNEGTDLVVTTVSYTLDENIENITITASLTTGITVTGNALNNRITALSSGKNILIGGDGDDEYYIRSTTSEADDIVIEAENGGIDTVISLQNYVLPDNVENLRLVGTAIKGTGNELDNVITGNAHANILNGGAGNDTLIGGLGNDTYLFSAGSGVDVIIENDATSGNIDVAQWGVGIDYNRLWFARDNNNLNVSVIGTNDMVVIQDWYLGNAYRVEQFISGDGKTMRHTNVDALVQAMAGFAPPSSGQTSLPQNYVNTLNPVLAASWQ